MEWIDVPAKGLTLRDIRRITRRDQAESEDIRKAVEEILANVEQDGDEAVRMYTKKFDGVAIEDFLVTPEEIDRAVAAVGPDFMSILEEGAANIRAYHERQVEKTWFDTFRPGVRLGAKFTPIQRVGVYVPGGTAAYPSTVLMDTIPAHVAGVPSIAVFTPPAKDGSVNPYIWQRLTSPVLRKFTRSAGPKGLPLLRTVRKALHRSLKSSARAMPM